MQITAKKTGVLESRPGFKRQLQLQIQNEDE